MARGKRAEALTKGTRYVAEQALNELYQEYGQPSSDALSFGQWMVRRVWDVEHKPTAGRLVIVLDLNEPDEAPPVTGVLAADESDQCPSISNGQRCLFNNHDLTAVQHYFG